MKSGKANTLSVQVSVQLSEDLICGVLCAAYEGGSNYWARQVAGNNPYDWVDKKDLSKGLRFTPGFVATIMDCEDDGKQWTLNQDKIITGLQVMATKYPHHFADIQKENYDAETGDVLLQCSLFGKVIYG